MNAVMKVDRLQLRGKLEAKIEEIRNSDPSYYGESRSAVLEVLEQRRKGETPDDFSARLVEWYRKVADGIEDDTIRLTAKGSLATGYAPPRPKPGEFGKFAGWTEAQLQERLDYYERQIRDAIKPLATAIELIDMSNDERIEISTADYHQLLGR